jgi:hypothetical protein
VTPEGDEIRHGWYQWANFILFAQAIFFYTPHYIWKSRDGGKLTMMIQDLDHEDLDDPATKKDRRMATVNYFVRTMGSHNFYVLKYIMCEVLNLINIFVQMWLMNIFVGFPFSTFNFSTFGTEVFALSGLPYEDRVDPMSKVFPKVTKCTYNDYGGVSGAEMSKDGQCLLPINIINEKIYIYLWLWMIMLLCWTSIHLLTRLITMASTHIRILDIYVKHALRHGYRQ